MIFTSSFGNDENRSVLEYSKFFNTLVKAFDSRLCGLRSKKAFGMAIGRGVRKKLNINY